MTNKKFENRLNTIWIGIGYALIAIGVLSLVCKLIVNI